MTGPGYGGSQPGPFGHISTTDLYPAAGPRDLARR
jgi:hypothetical protein